MDCSSDPDDYKTEEFKCYIQNGKGKILSVLHIPSKKPLIAKVYNLEKIKGDLISIQVSSKS